MNMARILLGVTGSVAAIKTPLLFQELRRQGHEVKVVATHAALYFFATWELDGSLPESPRNRDVLILDEDEWPGREEGKRWQREEPVLHIELRRWADLLLIAPLDANTLAKLANGFADNCLTCVWRAWDSKRPVVLAPAMNTMMWDHPLTARHLRQLAADAEGEVTGTDPIELTVQINRLCERLRVVGPQSKRLACGDEGIGAMADVSEIITVVNEFV